MIYFADMHDVVTLECGQNRFQVCPGARVNISCFTETAIGHLRWVNSSDVDDWLAVFDSTSAVNDVVTKDNISFTLHNKYEIHNGRHLYYSTAAIIIMKDIKIGCSDGEDIKHCEVATTSE